MPDFMFPQMTDDRWAPPGWRPGLVDYLVRVFTNATAFSPTDTMPLTGRAKWLMSAQSLTALVTVGLVVARGSEHPQRLGVAESAIEKGRRA